MKKWKRKITSKSLINKKLLSNRPIGISYKNSTKSLIKSEIESSMSHSFTQWTMTEILLQTGNLEELKSNNFHHIHLMRKKPLAQKIFQLLKSLARNCFMVLL